MGQPRRRVYLDGGSFDGKAASAPLFPEALTIRVVDDGKFWTETYVHVAGQTMVTSGEGALPVMRFHRREVD
jgi:hypothetical protein